MDMFQEVRLDRVLKFALDRTAPVPYEGDVESLVDDLATVGVEVAIEGADGEAKSLVIKYDYLELKRRATRRAGRKMTEVRFDSPLSETTAAEALDWLESHTVEEGMEALGGVSRAVYYRRKKRLGELRDQDPGSKTWSW